MEHGAWIRDNYRFTLWRIWDATKPMLAWLMLNPSTADATDDDPTVRRCIHFAKTHGHGAIWIVNLWPIRTPYPADLWPKVPWLPDGVLFENENVVRKIGREAGMRVAAFGCEAGRRNPEHVARMVKAFGDDLRCLGTTDDAWPLHPLARGKFAIPNDRRLEAWI